MAFPKWFDRVYRSPDESTGRAIARLQVETGLGYSTIYYALRGARVSGPCALAIEKRSGGRVRAGSLITGPTRNEIRDMARAAS